MRYICISICSVSHLGYLCGFRSVAVNAYQMGTVTETRTQPANHAESNQMSLANNDKQDAYCKTWRQILHCRWVIVNYSDSSHHRFSTTHSPAVPLLVCPICSRQKACMERFYIPIAAAFLMLIVTNKLNNMQHSADTSLQH